MPAISGNHVIEGAVANGRTTAGAPAAGTSAVQTLTIGGTPTGGTFKLALDGIQSAAIAWSATNATLLANILAALVAMPNIGAAGVTVAAGTLTAGIGTITLTFAAQNATRVISTMTVADNSLTGTTPTLAVATTTPGVNADGLGAPKGALLTRLDTGVLYINTGTALNPTFVTVGSQT